MGCIERLTRIITGWKWHRDVDHFARKWPQCTAGRQHALGDPPGLIGDRYPVFNPELRRLPLPVQHGDVQHRSTSGRHFCPTVEQQLDGPNLAVMRGAVQRGVLRGALVWITPVVEQVTFDQASLALSVGETADVVPTVVASNQQVLEGAAGGDVEYTVLDPTVASVSVQDDKVVITALAAGSTQLDVSRRDESIVVVPDTGITYTPLPITVS